METSLEHIEIVTKKGPIPTHSSTLKCCGPGGKSEKNGTDMDAVLNPRLIIVNPRLIMMNPRLIIVNPRLLIVNPRLILVNPMLLIVNPRLIIVNPRLQPDFNSYSRPDLPRTY